MTAFGDKLRALAAEADALLSGQPIPPPPIPSPQPVPQDPFSDVAIKALASSLGYDRCVIIPMEFPPSGFTKYITSSFGGFFSRDTVVAPFIAPPPDEFLQMTYVPTGGMTGSGLWRQFSLAEKPLVFAAGEGVVVSGIASNLDLKLATKLSPYTTTILVPGKRYFLNINNKDVNGNSGPLERYDLSIAIANNRP